MSTPTPTPLGDPQEEVISVQFPEKIDFEEAKDFKLIKKQMKKGIEQMEMIMRTSLESIDKCYKENIKSLRDNLMLKE